MTKLERVIVETLIYYYAHMQEGDSEGMEIAMDNLVASVEDAVPALKKLSKNKMKLSCPKCKEEEVKIYGNNWNELDLKGNEVLAWGDDCGHTWVAVDLNA